VVCGSFLSMRRVDDRLTFHRPEPVRAKKAQVKAQPFPCGVDYEERADSASSPFTTTPGSAKARRTKSAEEQVTQDK
jgi:hypothetical protein